MKPEKQLRKKNTKANSPGKDPADLLLQDVRGLIDAARKRVAVTAHAELTILYWQVGHRIRSEVLRDRRAEYGQAVIEGLSQDLTHAYGRGWSAKHLRHCLRSAEIFSEADIVSAARRQLTWTHVKSVLYMEGQLKREFYLEMAQLEGWSSRQLQERIQSMLFERTAISKRPETTIRAEIQALRREGRLATDLAFRDPYLLDFLGLSETFSEQDLENAILAELQRFLIELGSDFAFLGRQKRIWIDARDYYIDLLFFHRRLSCLVAIDLKIGEFEAACKGQMELYLRYLEKNDMRPGENPPLGLILCTGKNQEHVELLQLDRSNIRVAEYLTLLPPRELLAARLHQSIELARLRLSEKSGEDRDP